MDPIHGILFQYVRFTSFCTLANMRLSVFFAMLYTPIYKNGFCFVSFYQHPLVACLSIDF